MILDLLGALARVNLVVAAAVLVVAALRKPARRAFGARAAYLLWIVLPLAGAAVLAPPLGASAPPPLAAPQAVEAAVAVVAVAADAAVSRAPGLPLGLAALWGLGGLVAAAVLLSRQARFVSGLGRLTPTAPRVWQAERSAAGPAVIGALFPRIVTPADFEARFAPGEREVVLAHEQAHLARGDAAVNALAAAVACLCWFNPLVHLGVRLMRLDQELACDAAVLGRFPEKRRLYAEVLLKTQLSNQALPFGCGWPPAGEHPLKARIAMLKAPLPVPARRLAGVGLVTLLGVGAAAAAAWAAQPGPPMAASAAKDAHAAEPAQPKSAGPGAETASLMPDWMAKPDAVDVRAFYPPAAKAANLDGRATIACRVDGAGKLGACQAVSEAPEGAGFGAAALALADKFQMKPLDRNGRATAGQDVRIPFRFLVPTPAAN